MGFRVFSSLPQAMLIAGIALLVLGLILIGRAWWPRRKGETRHCKRCNYNLQGLQSSQCPECGQALTPATMIKGQRHRRPALAAFAIFLLLIGLASTLLSQSQRILKTDWYSYKPTDWIIADLKSSDIALYDRAWKEIDYRLTAKKFSPRQEQNLRSASIEALTRSSLGAKDELLSHLLDHFQELAASQQDFVVDRILAGLSSSTNFISNTSWSRIQDLQRDMLLSPPQSSRLIEAALRAQVSPCNQPIQKWLMRELGDNAIANNLTPTQRERFFNQAMNLTLVARRDARAGEPLPYEIRISGDGPREGWSSGQRLISLLIDDQQLQDNWWVRSGTLTSDSISQSLQFAQPGKHILRIVLQTAAFNGEVDWTRNGKPLWTKTSTLSAPFIILPRNNSNDLQIKSDKAMVEPLRAAIRFGADLLYNRAEIRIALQDCPANVAFDVIARLDGTEYLFGAFTANAGESRRLDFTAPDDFPRTPPINHVDLIFRSRESLARNTVDLYEIWSGELIFSDVVFHSNR